eukprot:1034461-Pyramimonas_sp.AAC.1
MLRSGHSNGAVSLRRPWEDIPRWLFAAIRSKPKEQEAIISGGLACAGQSAVEQVAREWEVFWCPPARNQEPPLSSGNTERSLRDISADDIYSVPQCFPPGTALGREALHPRSLLFASRASVEPLA